MKVPTLYIIVPCYNEEAILPSTHRLLSDKLTQLTSTGKISPESRIMFVDDGSTDQTWNLIKEFLNAFTQPIREFLERQNPIRRHCRVRR